MEQAERDRLTRLELIYPDIKQSLDKIASNQEVLTKLELDADMNKRFRDNFNEDVKRLIDNRLNTIQFEEALNEQIEKRVMIIFDKSAVRNDLTAKIKGVFNDEFKKIQLNLFLKITGIVSSVAVAVAIGMAKGVFGG